MAIWPFNRKKSSENLPEEMKEYYETGRKQRTGMAWLLALGTLVVTVLLAMLLFFGGRWVYDKFANDDADQQPTTEQADEGSTNTGQQPTPPPADPPVNTANQGSNQQGSSSANTAAPSSAATPSATPDAGPTGSEIPDTGPGPNGLQ